MTKEELQFLIDNPVIENRSLEYKKDLKIIRDAEKREFLADISSFANSIGGKIYFGIAEDRSTGKPKELTGIDIDNVDQFIQKLENMISTGIEPRIVGIEIDYCEITQGKYILLANIPKSWLSPHRVTFINDGHFYLRTTSGKHKLDVSELRVAFNIADATTKKIKTFREERIGNIIAGEAPLELTDNKSYVLLHMVPFNSLTIGTLYDINPSRYDKLIPMYIINGWNTSFNYDGYIAFGADKLGKCYSYTQLFKNGIIEALEADFLKEDDTGRYLYPNSFESEILRSLRNYLLVQKAIEVQLPIFIFLTLIGCKDFTLFTEEFPRKRHIMKFHKNILFLPEVLVEDYNAIPQKFFRPVLDSIWNACGYYECPNYDDDDKYMFTRI